MLAFWEGKQVYPIFLIHGMADRNFFFARSFGKITKFLTDQGYEVYVSRQDAIGSIENNALFLKKQLEEIMAKSQAKGIHIIAHSKGGLEARYLITKLAMGKYVKSLTTLSTPHHGSEMSARILRMPHFLAKIICGYWNFLYRLFGDKKPDLYRLAAELTPEYLKKFNEEVPNLEGVYYQSYAAFVEKHQGTLLMLVPKAFQRSFGANRTDGIVEVESAKWGEYQGEVAVEHHNLVDFFTGKKKRKLILELYLKIITRLKEKEIELEKALYKVE